MTQLFDDAYRWLCRRRQHHPAGADIRDLRQTWKDLRTRVIEQVACGAYQVSVQTKITLACGETIALWSACDALVLKVITSLLQDLLQPLFLKTCFHLKGHGGLKGAVRAVCRHYRTYPFVCKTDVKSYYDSINHYTLLLRLHDLLQGIRGTAVYDLIITYVWQFLNRTVEWGGLYRTITQGIPRASSLSPLLGAIYLLDLDRRMALLDVVYLRSMDDILIFAPTRWKLRKAIRVLNQTLEEFGLEQHPDKTFIGRTERGFDVLGYHFSPASREGDACTLALADHTILRMEAHALRLYEQEPPEIRLERLGAYLMRWRRWTRAGLPTGPREGRRVGPIHANPVSTTRCPVRCGGAAA